MHDASHQPPLIRLKLNTVTQRSICRLHLETKPNRFASNILLQRVSTVVRLLRYHRIVYWNVLLTRKGVQKFPVESSEQQSNLSDCHQLPSCRCQPRARSTSDPQNDSVLWHCWWRSYEYDMRSQYNKRRGSVAYPLLKRTAKSKWN